jgi:hypothetical protein
MMRVMHILSSLDSILFLFIINNDRHWLHRLSQIQIPYYHDHDDALLYMENVLMMHISSSITYTVLWIMFWQVLIKLSQTLCIFANNFIASFVKENNGRFVGKF